ncbi:MAG TPA: PIN domain-containing protein [Bryobacteraceae bacterium]|nr:PIN domain-containing protein [Bryobacteraceae bacterium]
MSVFVDTSALYAVFDHDDANHSRAKAVWAEWLHEDTVLVTNNYVLVETTALLQHRLGVAAVRALHEDVVPVLQVDWVSEEQHRTGAEAMLAAARRKLSLVDCVSFQTMRRHGLRIAFCFDAHFREQGFETRP